MKRYISSDKPKLAQTGNFIFTKGKNIRKPVRNYKTLLKEHIQNRAVQTKEREKPLSAEMQNWIQCITE